MRKNRFGTLENGVIFKMADVQETKKSSLKFLKNDYGACEVEKSTDDLTWEIKGPFEGFLRNTLVELVDENPTILEEGE